MSMKIYIAGSIAGGRNDADLYTRMLGQLQQYGTVIAGGRNDADLYTRLLGQLQQYGTVLTKHVASPTVVQGIHTFIIICLGPKCV